MSEKWITVKEASNFRRCSERNILDLIKRGRLKGKKEGRRWLVLMDVSEVASEKTSELSEDIRKLSEVVSTLENQLSEKDEQITSLREQLSEKDVQIREKDMQIGQLHQLLAVEKNQTQQLLERQLLPFWRRWRKKKQLPEATIIDEEQ